MTYCVGFLLQQGMVFASDTRTNAGVDQVAIVPKMHIFEVKDERVIVLMTAGNLAITQSVVNSLKLKLMDPENTSLNNVGSLFEAASLVGDEVRATFARDGAFLKDHDIDFNATILIGGQIKGEIPRLFKVYAAGNFIEIGHDTPYLQIGETKYGKPIIDRVVKYDTDMMDAVKCLLVSFDSTIRSNVSVAAPIDLLIYRTDSFNADCKQRLNESDPYFSTIRLGWGAGLKQVFSDLPSPDWCKS